MGVEDSDRKNGGVKIASVGVENDMPEEESPSLPPNPELDEAVQEALRSVERAGKKVTDVRENAAELGQQERESLQNHIRDLHLKLMEKEKELEERNKDVEGYKDQAARRQADLENYRKRVQKEKADQFNYGNEEIAREFLEVLDNLERALAHGKADTQGLLDGLELTRKIFEQAFQKFGIVPIEALGKKFDPNLHQAVAQIASADHEPGMVIEEQQRGFMLKDRLLRPSMVVVAGGPHEGETNSQ